MKLPFIPSSPELGRLLDSIMQAVHVRTGGRIRGLHVCVNDGCVVVSGQTSTYYNKQLVTHAVRDAVVDMSVRNHVEVS